MGYRVIQWATGNLGRAAIEGIVSHPELELVGCWVHSPEKAGRDVGEIVGIAEIGVRATSDVDALLAMDADCVLYSPLFGKPKEVMRMLESGKNVVTPLGWFFPDRNSKTTVELEAACRRGGVTLHGTGIHPGGITERFPLMISALSRNIRHVRAEEFSDIRSYAAVNWLMGEEHLDPPWTFGPERERFEIEISGDPPAKVTFHGLHPTDMRAAQKRNPGMVATAIHCVSAIPFVCRAAPGILSYLDLPLVHGRADAALARPR